MVAPLRLAAALCALTPIGAWSQAIESAYVEIIPGGSSDADDVLAVERGVELVLCQAGMKPRVGGREDRAELKLVASLTKAEFEPHENAREFAGRCEITDAGAILPGGARIALPDMAIARRSPIQRGRGAAESFFVACGASFTRAALDTLKERVKLRGRGCAAVGAGLPTPARYRRAAPGPRP
jgi:hypothetical protein